MNRARKNIEQLKEQLREDILANGMQYKRAIIKQIDKLYRASGSNNIEDFASTFLRDFKLSDKDYKLLLGDLQTTQKQIAQTWDNHFDIPNGNYEKLIAVNSIDFSKTSLEDDVKKAVTNEAKKAINGDLGFDSLRQKLKNTGLGSDEAYTLANTALAQADNGYMAEVASQADVIYYMYDGIISANSRPFCRDHFKRVYTLAELSAMDNHQGLDVASSLGGYNCQHYLTPLVNYVRLEYGEKFNPAHYKNAA